MLARQKVNFNYISCGTYQDGGLVAGTVYHTVRAVWREQVLDRLCGLLA